MGEALETVKYSLKLYIKLLRVVIAVKSRNWQETFISSEFLYFAQKLVLSFRKGYFYFYFICKINLVEKVIIKTENGSLNCFKFCFLLMKSEKKNNVTHVGKVLSFHVLC